MNKYTIFVAEIGCRNFNFDENVITNMVVLYINPRISCNLIRGFLVICSKIQSVLLCLSISVWNPLR